MSEKEIPMEELGPTEEVRNNDDGVTDPGSSGAGGVAEAKVSKKVLRPVSSSCIPSSTSTSSSSSQRRRLTGGASILRNLTRRGSVGSSLNENFDPSDPSSMEGQKFILRCPVQLTINSHTRSRSLFLYEDLLICAKQKSPTNFHTKHRIELRDLWLGSDGPDSTMGVSSEGPWSTTDEGGVQSEAGGAGGGVGGCDLTIGWPTMQATIKFPSSEERDSWRTKLQELMELAQEKESPHTIVRIVQNEEQFSVTKSVIVRQSETAQMVLARCINRFHIPNETLNDFQLSVLKSKNDLPIPLTGQEILYRIQMKQNREQQENEKDAATADMDLESGEGLVFQLTPTEKKNVLKRTLLASEDGKPAKRASSLTRFFRTTFRLHDEGKLFRRNLNELCQDGKLCWRLMMMLSHLFVHGPTCEEVFRKPPSIKVHRVLQERLDRSKDFDFNNVNACEMSQLLKAFLTSLPECLLTLELYPRWAEVAEMEDKRKALLYYRGLIDLLPDSNVLLLRHLICVLHRISINHKINRMAPKCLSICIGQCILWLPPPPLKPPSSEATSNDINKEIKQLGIANSVTETLIEFAEDIFGVEVLHLLDHLSVDTTALGGTADAPATFTDGLHVTRNVNNEPVNSGLVPTADNNCVLGRSYSSCLNHSTMSLTDDVKDTELKRLRESLGGDTSLKLNSSWHLSGSGYVPQEYIRPRPDGQSLDSSLSSSQASYLDIFPDATKVTSETKRPHLTLSIPRGDDVEHDSTAKFYMASADSPILGESAGTTPATDTGSTGPVLLTEDWKNSTLSAEAVTKPGLVSEYLTKHEFRSQESKRREFFSENKQKGSSVRIELKDNNNTRLASDELLSPNTHYSCSESSSPSVFLFPETVNLPSPLSAEQFATEYTSLQSFQTQNLSSQLQLQSPEEKSPRSRTQTSSPSSRKFTPLKSKPTDLVIVSPRLRQSAAETSLKSPLQTPEQTNRNSEGTTTPDDGYSSTLSSAKLALQTSVGRNFELLPSKMEKNLKGYSKHDENQNASSSSRASSSEMQFSSYAGSLKQNRTELGTPTGIVNRLKSEFALRELSQQKQRPPSLSHIPLSANKELFSKETFRSSLSQPCKDSISKSERFQRSDSSPLPPQGHSETVRQNRYDKTCQEDPVVMPNSRSSCTSTRSRQGSTHEVVSDPGVPGCAANYLKSPEPSSNPQTPLHETQRSIAQFDSLNRPSETDKNNRSLHLDFATHSRTSPLRTNTSENDGQTGQASLKKPLVKCASLPLKSPVTPSPTPEKPVHVTSMDYQVLDKNALQASVARRGLSPSKDLRMSTADKTSATGKNRESVDDNTSAPKELDSLSEHPQKRSSKPRLFHSEPKIVISNSFKHEIERTRSDISGIASKTTTEADEERLNEANKENLSSRNSILKRNSGIVENSTPEKLSKRSKESVDSTVETNNDDDTAPKSPDVQKMSVKNRDWHKELLEEYAIPSSTPSSSSTQTKTAVNKPSQRLAVLGPKISFTAMPNPAYQGISSKPMKSTDKVLRKP